MGRTKGREEMREEEEGEEAGGGDCERRARARRTSSSPPLHRVPGQPPVPNLNEKPECEPRLRFWPVEPPYSPPRDGHGGFHRHTTASRLAPCGPQNKTWTGARCSLAFVSALALQVIFAVPLPCRPWFSSGPECLLGSWPRNDASKKRPPPSNLLPPPDCPGARGGRERRRERKATEGKGVRGREDHCCFLSHRNIFWLLSFP